jgi:hypothetical protein
MLPLSLSLPSTIFEPLIEQLLLTSIALCLRASPCDRSSGTASHWLTTERRVRRSRQLPSIPLHASLDRDSSCAKSTRCEQAITGAATWVSRRRAVKENLNVERCLGLAASGNLLVHCRYGTDCANATRDCQARSADFMLPELDKQYTICWSDD